MFIDFPQVDLASLACAHPVGDPPCLRGQDFQKIITLLQRLPQSPRQVHRYRFDLPRRLMARGDQSGDQISRSPRRKRGEGGTDFSMCSSFPSIPLDVFRSSFISLKFADPLSGRAHGNKPIVVSSAVVSSMVISSIVVNSKAAAEFEY